MCNSKSTLVFHQSSFYIFCIESAAQRPKLKLLPRTVKDPVHSVVQTERNAAIFGTGKPRDKVPNLTDMLCFPLIFFF